MNTETHLTKSANEVPEKMQERATVAPLVDIFENKDQILIFADLPGVSKETLSINFDKGQLALEGQPRKFSASEEPFTFRRTFVVPQGIDAEKIEASIHNGVLRVALPKPAALKPRQIEVKAV